MPGEKSVRNAPEGRVVTLCVEHFSIAIFPTILYIWRAAIG